MGSLGRIEKQVHLVLGYRVYAGLVLDPHEESHSRDFAGPWHDRTPAALAGESRLWRSRKQMLSNFGPQTVGADDEIVAISSPVGEFHAHAGAILLDGHERDTKMHLDSCCERGIRHELTQHRSHDRALTWDLRTGEARGGQLHYIVASAVIDIDAVSAEAALEHLLDDPELSEGTLRRR